MTSYTPREGDTVNIRELTVGKTAVTGQPFVQYTPHGSIGPDALAELVAAGKVELIARAEPDWQYGDVGQHIETGALYRFLPDPFNDPQPWFLCNTPVHWYSRSELAGKLQRMRLVPEDEAPAPVTSHWHVCRGGAERQPGGTPQDHQWEHVGTPGCGQGEALACPDCGPAPGEVAPVGAEPPPGLYRDSAGAAWHHDSVCWRTVSDEATYSWHTAKDYAPFTPVFTLDELIPDPDDRKAVALIVGAADQLPASVTEPIAWGVAVNVLRVLRAKAAERTPPGGAS